MVCLKVRYGPYESNGVIKHRPQRLHGLIKTLTKKGYELELIPTEHLDRLTVDVGNFTIFRCNIKNLKFNMDSDFDELCQEAITTIEEAMTRIESPDNVAKHISVKRGLRMAGYTGNESEYMDSSIAVIYVIDKEKPAFGSVYKQLDSTANEQQVVGVLGTGFDSAPYVTDDQRSSYSGFSNVSDVGVFSNLSNPVVGSDDMDVQRQEVEIYSSKTPDEDLTPKNSLKEGKSAENQDVKEVGFIDSTGAVAKRTISGSGHHRRSHGKVSSGHLHHHRSRNGEIRDMDEAIGEKSEWGVDAAAEVAEEEPRRKAKSVGSVLKSLLREVRSHKDDEDTEHGSVSFSKLDAMGDEEDPSDSFLYLTESVYRAI